MEESYSEKRQRLQDEYEAALRHLGDKKKAYARQKNTHQEIEARVRADIYGDGSSFIGENDPRITALLFQNDEIIASRVASMDLGEKLYDAGEAVEIAASRLVHVYD